MIGFYLMTADAAEEFYKRSIHKEAVTEEEKLAILKEMEAEGLIFARGSTNETKEELAKRLAEVANVLVVESKKRKPGYRPDGD